MFNKVISVLTNVKSHEAAKGPKEDIYPKVDEALQEGYVVREVISHYHPDGGTVQYLFILEKNN